MTLRLILFAATCSLLAACGPSGIPASNIEWVSDYEDGVAILATKDGLFYFADKDLVPVTDVGFSLLEPFCDGYAVAVSTTKKDGMTTNAVHIVSRSGEIVETFGPDASPLIVPGGKAWVFSENGIALKELATGRKLIEERAWINTYSPSGTVVLARSLRDRHPVGSDYARLVEFMMVDRDGRILVPWGRIGFIGKLSNGLAVATNSAQGAFKGSSEYILKISRSNINDPTYGYIDESGSWVIPEKFYEAQDFNRAGYAQVLVEPKRYFAINETKYIDKSGRVLAGEERDVAMRSFRK